MSTVCPPIRFGVKRWIFFIYGWLLFDVKFPNNSYPVSNFYLYFSYLDTGRLYIHSILPSVQTP